METIIIKKLTLNDIDQLQKISRQTFYETFSAGNTEENMQKYLEEGFSAEKLSAELNDNNSVFYFAITADIVQESGFRKNPPDFYCIVAEDNDKIAGMLVYYFLPYTAQNRPAVYMKELYVDESYRGQKIGEQLMNALKTEAKLNNCAQINCPTF